MRKCSFDSLASVFSAISESMALYLPVDGESGASYEKWEEGKAYSTALNTVRSPKDFFFPQMEDLVKFKTEGNILQKVEGIL